MGVAVYTPIHNVSLVPIKLYSLTEVVGDGCCITGEGDSNFHWSCLRVV